MDDTDAILRNEGTYITATDYYGFKVASSEFYEVYRDQIGMRIWKIAQAREGEEVFQL